MLIICTDTACSSIYVVCAYLYSACISAYLVLISPHRYQQEFGFTIPDRAIIVDDIRVRGKGKACSHNQVPLPLAEEPPAVLVVSRPAYMYIHSIHQPSLSLCEYL